MSSSRNLKWREMSAGRKMVFVAATAVQLSLAVGAWIDLARRPSSRVRGPRAVWALIIGINFVGPLTYLRWGRVRGEEPAGDAHELKFEPTAGQ